jgi:glycosyltransferase involved in cell wall biosynthesis
MKRVLLIAFYFPPRNHIAGYRTACFAKYLPEHGWLPTVICEDWPAGRPNYDPDFVENIPAEVEIIRIPPPPHKSPLQKFLLRKLLPYWGPHMAPYLWRQEARQTMRELSRRVRFDVLWATSDPLVTLGLAAEAAAELNVPWLADIRDSFNVQPRGSWYKRPIWAYHERRLCRQAQAIVTVSSHLAKGLARAVGRPVQVIENGYDPELFPATPPPLTQKPVFTIAYTGNLTLPQQNPRPVFQAVELMLRNGTAPPNGIELVFYGPSVEQLNAAFPGVTQSLPVRVFPLIPHKQIAAVQQASSVLLLLTLAGQKGVLTGKLFDYLGARRPVLAVPDDQGDVADLLQQTGAGLTASTPEQIARVLQDWRREWEKTGEIQMPRNEKAVEHYSRRNQAKRLAAMLDSLVTGNDGV